MIILRLSLLLGASIASIAGLRLILESFSSPNVYRKDVIQEFLLAKASLTGVAPYLSLPELGQTILGRLPAPLLSHPTPHPPPVVVLSLPFGLLDYQAAAVLWFLMECSLLFLSIFLLLRWLEVSRIWKIAFLVFFLAFGWEPLLYEVVNGQLEIILLSLCVGVWLSYTRNYKILAGVLLGISISLKFFAWPVLLFFALKREWRFVIPAGLTFIVLNLAAGILIGFDQLIYYYLVVSQLVTNLYRAYSANFSLFSIGWRTFNGTSSPILIGVEADPLIPSLLAANLSAYLLPLIFLICILILVNKIKNIDIRFAILFSASLLVNPIVWNHYLVIAILPVVIIGRYLIQSNAPKSSLLFFLLVLGLFYFRQTAFEELAYTIGGVEPHMGISVKVSFWTSLLSLAPILPILGLIWFGWRLRFVAPAPESSPARSDISILRSAPSR